MQLSNILDLFSFLNAMLSIVDESKVPTKQDEVTHPLSGSGVQGALKFLTIKVCNSVGYRNSFNYCLHGNGLT